MASVIADSIHVLKTTYLVEFLVAAVIFTAVTHIGSSRLFRGFPRIQRTFALIVGVALATGLMRWIMPRGYALHHLGPLALGFLGVVLLVIVYMALRQVGSVWMGMVFAAAVAVTATLMIGYDLDSLREALSLVIGLLILVLLIAFSAKERPFLGRNQQPRRMLAMDRVDVRGLYDDQYTSQRLLRGFQRLQQQVNQPTSSIDADRIDQQLHEMLPVEGALTEHLAELRKQCHYARNGHLARIEEITEQYQSMSSAERRRASDQLKREYEAAKMDERLEKLNRMAAVIEKRVRHLTMQGRQQVQQGNWSQVEKVLTTAKKLQAQHHRMVERIEQTQSRLTVLARKAAGY